MKSWIARILLNNNNEAIESEVSIETEKFFFYSDEWPFFSFIHHFRFIIRLKEIRKMEASSSMLF